MRTELDFVTFRKLEVRGSEGPQQVWELLFDQKVFAKAEVFEGEAQWGVRLMDQAPQLSPKDLQDLVSKMLVWEVGCRADTVELVLGRDHSRHTLVRVGAEYV